jgi:hypothetical protein
MDGCPGAPGPDSVPPPMRAPLVERVTPVAGSMVGTLLALGLLLAMVTAGIALVASTEGRPDTTAEIRYRDPAFQPCPASLRRTTPDPATLRCASVPVTNEGLGEGIARCLLTDGVRGEARFGLEGIHIHTVELAPGATEELLVRIEGAREPSLPLVTCTSEPPPPV